MIDHLILDGGGPIINYDIVSVGQTDNGAIKFMRVRFEEFQIDVHFPLSKPFKFYDKETGYFQDYYAIDWENADRVRMQLEHKNFVSPSD